MKVVYGVFVETFSGVKGAGGAPCFFVSMICCVVMGDASPKSGNRREAKPQTIAGYSIVISHFLKTML